MRLDKQYPGLWEGISGKQWDPGLPGIACFAVKAKQGATQSSVIGSDEPNLLDFLFFFLWKLWLSRITRGSK